MTDNLGHGPLEVEEQMRLKIAVLAGDGIGPEVTREATHILRAVAELGGHEFTFVEGLIGGTAITQTGSPLPTATLDAAPNYPVGG